MTQAVIPQTEVTVNEPQEREHLLTFAEYLEYEGEPDVIHELVRGKLTPMPTPSIEHADICEYLVYKLQRYFAFENLSMVAKSTVGVRTEENSARIPDALVCHQSLWDGIRARRGAAVLDFEEKPIIVVEVVSSDRSRDYVTKLREYEAAEIPEYWLVDPKKKLVRVFANPTQEGGYSFVDFTKDDSITSGQLDKLSLSVKELLAPPLVEELIKDELAKIKQESQRAEAERQRAQAERQRAEAERQRAQAASQRAEAERQRAEAERQQAETERQRAEAERQRAEKLAQRLLEMGVNPDEV